MQPGRGSTGVHFLATGTLFQMLPICRSTHVWFRGVRRYKMAQEIEGPASFSCALGSISLPGAISKPTSPAQAHHDELLGLGLHTSNLKYAHLGAGTAG